MKISWFTVAATSTVLAISANLLATEQPSGVKSHLLALQDKFANPGSFVIDEGESLFHAPGGPNNVSLEQCDFGLGAGKLEGAYAQLPRYFADTGRVQDAESRLVTCMKTLQGFSEEEIKAKLYANQKTGESNTFLESVTMYIAAQSDGMPINTPLDHPKELEAIAVGQRLFSVRRGPMDFSCTTCHSQSGKRIRLQELGNYFEEAGDAKSTMSSWPTYRISHGVVRTLQHRMWDCHWQMRLPDIDYGSPVSVALISYLNDKARGEELNIPGMKR